MSQINPTTVMAAGVMTGTDVLTTNPLDLLTMSRAAIEAVWTGDPVGTFRVLGSVSGVNFADMGLAIPAAAAIPDSRIMNLYGLGIRWIKLEYTNTSGDGVLTVYACAKA